MNQELGVLRLIICGSVDDGKSTLIGRLLLDSNAVLDDQLAQINEASKRRGAANTDLSLLTDGLRAERQQGITIDVAYRYFSTARRRFVLIDAPGHEQYTSNMVTGASQADVALILLDASKGMTQQTRRHAYLVHLLQIPKVVVAVNKMDLVGYSREVYWRHVEEVTAWFGKACAGKPVMCIPVSALDGDNVVQTTRSMPWFDGPNLLEYLENLDLGQVAVSHDRMFVQTVIRKGEAHEDEQRGYAGRVASGVFEVGQSVWVGPQGMNATIGALERYGERVPRVSRGQSVTVFLREDIDVGRGDLLCNRADPAESSRSLHATVVWMGQEPLAFDRWYACRLGTRWLKARVLEVQPLLEASELTRQAGDAVSKNDIVRAQLVCSEPVAYDAYQKDRTSGAFVLVDQETHETVAAGLSLTRNTNDTVDRPQTCLVVGANVMNVASTTLRYVGQRLARERGGGAAASVVVVTSSTPPLGDNPVPRLALDADATPLADFRPIAVSPDDVEALVRRMGNAPVVVGADCGWYGRTLDDGARALAHKLRSRVVLVVRLEAGCLNHALATFNVIRRDGVGVDAWVATADGRARPPDVDAEYALLQQVLEAPHWGLQEVRP